MKLVFICLDMLAALNTESFSHAPGRDFMLWELAQAALVSCNIADLITSSLSFSDSINFQLHQSTLVLKPVCCSWDKVYLVVKY